MTSKGLLLFPVLYQFLLVSCGPDISTLPELENPIKSKLAIINKNQESDGNPYYSRTEFGFNSEGLPVQEVYTSFKFPESNYVAIFKYDAQGKVIAEERHGTLFRSVHRQSDSVLVNYQLGHRHMSFVVKNDKIVKQLYPTRSDTVEVSITYRYDSKNNLIASAWNTADFSSKYSDFESIPQNPFRLLEPILVLRPNFLTRSSPEISKKVVILSVEDSTEVFAEQYSELEYDPDGRITGISSHSPQTEMKFEYQ